VHALLQGRRPPEGLPFDDRPVQELHAWVWLQDLRPRRGKGTVHQMYILHLGSIGGVYHYMGGQTLVSEFDISTLGWCPWYNGGLFFALQIVPEDHQKSIPISVARVDPTTPKLTVYTRRPRSYPSYPLNGRHPKRTKSAGLPKMTKHSAREPQAGDARLVLRRRFLK
jgi:hypothetical protein